MTSSASTHERTTLADICSRRFGTCIIGASASDGSALRRNDLLVDVVRHGESTWNAEGRWQGQADPPLSDAGTSQAEAVALRYEGTTLDMIWSSDLTRARDTAKPVARKLGLDVKTLPAMREMDVGTWTGLTRREIAVRFPEEWDAVESGGDPVRGGGESRAHLMTRVRGAFASLTAESLAADARHVMLVTHGGVVREIALMALGLEVEGMRAVRRLAAPGNASVSVVATAGRRSRLLSYNDSSHVEHVRHTALEA